jgi:hypothetical protein
MEEWSNGVLKSWFFCRAKVDSHGSRLVAVEDEDDDEYEDENFDYATGAALRTGSGASALFAPDAPSETGML